VGDVANAALFHGASEAAAEPSTEAALPRMRVPRTVQPPSAPEAPGMAGRVGKMAVREALSHVPLGHKILGSFESDWAKPTTFKDWVQAFRGPKAEAPKPPTPPVPEGWGKGGYGTPVDEWGVSNPPSLFSKPEPPAAPAPKPPANALEKTPVAAPEAESQQPMAGPWRREADAAQRALHNRVGEYAAGKLQAHPEGADALNALKSGTNQQYADLANNEGIPKPQYLVNKTGKEWTADDMRRSIADHGKSLSPAKEVVVRYVVDKYEPKEIVKRTKGWR
jgi:hypothetical protein